MDVTFSGYKKILGLEIFLMDIKIHFYALVGGFIECNINLICCLSIVKKDFPDKTIYHIFADNHVLPRWYDHYILL